MLKTKKLSIETRSEIVPKFKCGISALKLKGDKQLLGQLKENWEETGDDSKKYKIIQNHTVSPVKVVVASNQLIRRLKEININKYVLRKVIDISENNKAKRLSIALEYIQKPPQFWYDVLWTNEAAFQFQGSFSIHFMHLQREKREDAVQPLNRFESGTVMFWACLSYYGFGDLVRIEGTLKQSGYTTILNDHAFVSGNRLFPTIDWILQHDNSP
ncbi:uncharacterized protein LOC129948511 [Eupeodes corollae]|uniref:uncharacterized protein LOC129948511 n=1 Tax=Eupeodes corollae TaxID=290404 RepID=UPI002492E21A|nr:uncharacterized protein LOC129948511 [Eupeodes corollae]